MPPPPAVRSPPPAKVSKYERAIELRRAKIQSQTAAKNRPAPIRKAVELSDKSIDRLIDGLPDRTLAELRQQWINTVRLDPKSSPHVARFHKALLNEWARRARRARHQDDYFKWPSTSGGNGDGTLHFDAWNEEGILRYLGYRVGSTQGEAAATRRRILDAAFSGELPPVNGFTYLQSWGPPVSAMRLKRLANEIARFVRHAKSKRSADMSSAIDDWEDDLDYLYMTYYVRNFGFSWPQVFH